MEPALQAIVLERLAELPDDDPVVDVVLGACESPEALEQALGGQAGPRREAPEVIAAAAPPGAYLREVVVEGFRGIGPAARLPLVAAPGLTLVVGRNGSGKSSFAEALEMLFTGRNERWRTRSQIWREGWRNLHHGDPVRLEATLVIDGRAGEARVARRWAPGDPLDRSATQGLDEAGWDDAVERYRPFLSYNELGALFEGRPTEFYDALSTILGLGELLEADRVLRDARRERDARAKDVRGAVPALIERLARVDDERARSAHLALARRPPDLDSVELAVLGELEGLDPEGELRVLRELARLEPPDPEAARALVPALRDAQTQLDALAGTDAEHARRLAELLETALRLHAAHGDQPDCPVCRQPPGLDFSWRVQTEVEAGDQRRRAEDALAARGQADQLARRARRLVETPPPPALGTARDVGIDPAEVEVAWRAWNTSPGGAPGELADHLEAAAPPLAAALEALRARADAELRRREDTWRPAALLLGEWLGRARQVEAEAAQLAALKGAAGWLKEAAAAIRAQRFAPLAEEARGNWELLRQGSNVSVREVGLEGAHNAASRRVTVDVTIDGVGAAALGVMSQGELHALALSIFLPRASLRESPFRFMVIDDPVQSMDPAKVDGLARVLQRAAAARQVVVFTHDDRLPEAVRRLAIPARVLEVTRRPGSVVEIREARNPLEQALDDARALVLTDNLPPAVAARVVPGFCRLAIEAGCTDAVRRRRLARGEPHAEIERVLVEARTLYQKASLALFDDPARGSDVLTALTNRVGPNAAGAFRRSNSGAHEADSGSLPDLVRDAAILARALAELR